MKKRILSILTALVLCLTLLPTAAMADTTPDWTGWTALTAETTSISGGTEESPKKYYLSGDVTLNAVIQVDGYVTLDLNGHTLTREDNQPAILVGYNNDGYLTLRDSSASRNGAVTSSSKTIEVLNGSLTLESGTVSGAHAIYVNQDTTVTLKGGTVSASSGTAVHLESSDNSKPVPTLNADGGTVEGVVKNYSGTITHSTGVTTATTFHGTVKNEGTIEWGTFYGTVDNTKGGTITTMGVATETALTSAITAGAATIKLMDDISLSSKLEITGTTTIDLNGKTLTGPNDAGSPTVISIASNGDLTIRDSAGNGKVVGYGNNIVGVNGAFTLESGTLKNSAGKYGIIIKGIATLKGGTVEGICDVWGGTLYADGGRVTEAVYTRHSRSSTITRHSDAAGTTRFAGGASNETGSIAAGEFYGSVTNCTDGTITGGTFYGTVVNQYRNAPPTCGGVAPASPGSIVNNGAFVFEGGKNRTGYDDNYDHIVVDVDEAYLKNTLQLAGTGYVQVDKDGSTTYFTNDGTPITDPTTKKVVTFDLNGGTGTIPPQGVYDNKPAARPADPTKTGWVFGGWYTDKNLTAPYDFKTPVANNLTLYAKWVAVDDLPAPEEDDSEPTYSVNLPGKTVNGELTVRPRSAEAGDTVTITVTPDKGYTLETLTVTDRKGNELELTNKGNGKFTFKMPAGRVDIKATFMEDNTILNFFTDVTPDKYYYDAVLWAAKNSITGGVTDTTFAPDQPCSRAQTVTFLYRAALALGLDVSVGENTNILSYTDAFDIPEYAIPAFQWAVGAGILQGDNGSLNPNGGCTRAQIVTFLFRFAAANGMDFMTLQELVSGYGDASGVPGYALSAFNWALAGGIVQGNNGNLNPASPCTRAQIVTFLYRLLGE